MLTDLDIKLTMLHHMNKHSLAQPANDTLKV